MAAVVNQSYLSIGSNIDPVINLRKAITLLKSFGEVKRLSNAWETHAIGSNGPNFYNVAVLFIHPHSAAELKSRVIAGTEKRLGRFRTEDKNRARTIDIDIIIFNGVIIDQTLWTRLYLAKTMSDLIPDLVHPTTGKTLAEIAHELLVIDWGILHPEVLPD